MTNYSNLEVIKGLDKTFSFTAKDDTGLDIVLTGFSFRFEIYDSDGVFKIVKTLPESIEDGLITFKISAGESNQLSSTQYEYRVLIYSDTFNPTILHTGIVTASSPKFSATLSPSNTTLSNGTIYITSPTILQKNTWYATTSMYHLIVNGIGTMTIDGRNLAGDVFGNLDTYQSLILNENQWQPNLTGMTAFRLKQVAGNNQVTFLP